jgi:RHS repeat-associated protein
VGGLVKGTLDGLATANRDLVEGKSYWGRMPLEYYASGTAHFEHQDWQGTERLRSSYNGTVEGTFQSLPFGDGFTTAGSDGDGYHFAGLDHDYSTSTDHAQFREYTPVLGRWFSPDPYYGSYDITNPQSMNRYSYVLNNPLASVDPSGLEAVAGGSDCGNDPICQQSGGGGGGGGGCAVDDSSCAGGGIGYDPFYGGYGGGILGTLAASEEAQWLGSGSIPWYMVQGGELMLMVADPMWYLPNPNYNGNDPNSQLIGTVAQVPQWLDMGTVGSTTGSETYSFFGPISGGGGGRGAPQTRAKQGSYPVFFGCYYNSVIETVTDEEDGRSWTAYGFMNSGALLAIKLKAYNPIGLTFVASASLMDIGAMVKANMNCTKKAGY